MKNIIKFLSAIALLFFVTSGAFAQVSYGSLKVRYTNAFLAPPPSIGFNVTFNQEVGYTSAPGFPQKAPTSTTINKASSASLGSTVTVQDPSAPIAGYTSYNTYFFTDFKIRTGGIPYYVLTASEVEDLNDGITVNIVASGYHFSLAKTFSGDDTIIVVTNND